MLSMTQSLRPVLPPRLHRNATSGTIRRRSDRALVVEDVSRRAGAEADPLLPVQVEVVKPRIQRVRQRPHVARRVQRLPGKTARRALAVLER